MYNGFVQEELVQLSRNPQSVCESYSQPFMVKTLKGYSAPGKAFIAGGYLVLEERFSAYVTALSSRMHAVVEAKYTENQPKTITVKSPQFASLEWNYTIDENFECHEKEGLKNPFIEATIFTAVAYGSLSLSYDIVITLYSDPGYHTQDDTTKKTTSDGSRKFLYHEKPINEVEKTGLGSSAGLVTVVTAALLCFFKKANVDEIQDQIHNCAQIAHCLAQKKVGSGFDVATAVYGSIIYNRFSPRVVNKIYQDRFFEDKTPTTKKAFVDHLTSVVDSKWEFRHAAWGLPPGIRLVMGDIKGGSETPKLVSKVLKWRAENPKESDELYSKLEEANSQFILSVVLLRLLHSQDKETYQYWLEKLTHEAPVAKNNPFYGITERFTTIRKYLCELTKVTGAEIEPPEQTKLLDACTTIEGCLGGVVPGAGGYDAICLLIAEKAIPSFVEKTKSDSRFAAVSWLRLHEETEGLRSEDPNSYEI